MTIAAIIIALTAIFLFREWQTASERRATEDTATNTINLLFTQLAESKAREGANTDALVNTQRTIIVEQQETISGLLTRLSMPDASAAADLNSRYVEMQNRDKPTTTVTPEPVPEMDFAIPVPEELEDLDTPAVAIPVTEQPLDL